MTNAPSVKKTNNILIVDGMHLCHRIFHVKKERKDAYTRDGKFVGFFYAFFRSMRNLRAKYPGYQIYVLWDSKTRWRYKKYPEYKKRTYSSEKEQLKRETERARMNDLVVKLKESLRFDSVHQLEAEGYEADDLAAFLVRHSKDDQRIILFTSDLDWAQLIKDNVVWVNPKNNKMVDAEAFEDEHGYPPTGIPIFKSLTGDKSDNIKGIYNFPKKDAKVIAQQIVSVEGFVYDKRCMNHLSERWKSEINANLDVLRLNYELVALYHDVKGMKFTKGSRDKFKLDECFRKYGVDFNNTGDKMRDFKRKRREKAKKEARA